jgi:hypothetical protein
MIDIERVDRLDTMIREKRIIRGAWTKGRDRACLLAALSPEAGSAESAEACPAEVMPGWFAEFTPWIDDTPSTNEWEKIVERYAGLARRWSALDDDAWEEARVDTLIMILKIARSYVADNRASALATIDKVLDWLRRGAPEVEGSRNERESMRAAASEAVGAAASTWRTTYSPKDCTAWAALRAAHAVTGPEKTKVAVDGADAACTTAGLRESSSVADQIALGALQIIEQKIINSEEFRDEEV